MQESKNLAIHCKQITLYDCITLPFDDQKNVRGLRVSLQLSDDIPITRC